jgi:hypothetical protein
MTTVPAERAYGSPADCSRVVLREAWQVSYWSRRFRCTVERLRGAIDSVGNAATDVDRFMRSQ